MPLMAPRVAEKWVPSARVANINCRGDLPLQDIAGSRPICGPAQPRFILDSQPARSTPVNQDDLSPSVFIVPAKRSCV